MGFQDQLSPIAGQNYCRMEHSAILLTCISNHMSLRPLFCLFLSGRLRQVSLYIPSQLLSLTPVVKDCYITKMIMRVQWLSGRVLDSRP